MNDLLSAVALKLEDRTVWLFGISVAFRNSSLSAFRTLAVRTNGRRESANYDNAAAAAAA